MRRILSAASWHDSIGDIALEKAAIIQMGRRGIPLIPSMEASQHQTSLIAGGAILISARSDMWWTALKNLHSPGPHVLIGASAQNGGDYSHLTDYRFVAVRDERSANAVSKWCTPSLGPCLATLLDVPDPEEMRSYPTYGFLDKQMKAGDFVVVDAQIDAKSVNIDIPQMRIDTRPWGKPPTKGAAFEHRSPETALTCIRAAKAVVCASLHLSIFALAAGTPFIYLEHAWGKGADYWGRAGFEEVIHKSPDIDILGAIADLKPHFERVRESEMSLASSLADTVADYLK